MCLSSIHRYFSLSLYIIDKYIFNILYTAVYISISFPLFLSLFSPFSHIHAHTFTHRFVLHLYILRLHLHQGHLRILSQTLTVRLFVSFPILLLMCTTAVMDCLASATTKMGNSVTHSTVCLQFLQKLLSRLPHQSQASSDQKPSCLTLFSL